MTPSRKTSDHCIPWHFRNADACWRGDVMRLPCNSQVKEEEKHGYRRENCPSGYECLTSWSSMPFNPYDSIDLQSPVVPWRFKFGDDMFRCTAFGLPPGVHFKEEEFHNYEKSEGVYTPSLPEPCTPPPSPCPSPCQVRAQPKSGPQPPPPLESGPIIEPPIPARGVMYPNVLGEREWHAVNRQVCKYNDDLVDQSEFSHYERNVKTCDPCDLPQACDGRMFKLPPTTLHPNESDLYSTKKLPRGEQLPPIYKYTEDQGHCNKRTTNGPCKYSGPGFLPQSPLGYLECMPFGYHCSEQASQSLCEKISPSPLNLCTSYYCPPCPYPSCYPCPSPCAYPPCSTPFCSSPVCVPCQ